MAALVIGPPSISSECYCNIMFLSYLHSGVLEWNAEPSDFTTTSRQNQGLHSLLLLFLTFGAAQKRTHLECVFIWSNGTRHLGD